MTINEFSAITEQRIPTPAELVEFAESQRWSFQVTKESAALLANKRDPLVIAFARMLSREPYRTNVLKLLANRGLAAEDSPQPKPKPLPVVAPLADSAPVICRLCSKDVSDPETRERMKDPLYCDRGGAKAVITKNGSMILPEEPRCPFKRN